MVIPAERRITPANTSTTTNETDHVMNPRRGIVKTRNNPRVTPRYQVSQVGFTTKRTTDGLAV